jgi:large subunit ribosomal protein L2
MGKRIISQARGKGSLTYRVRKKAFQYKVGYPSIKGKAIILKLIHSPAHSAPLAKIKSGDQIFFNPAFNNAFEGQEININSIKPISGDITPIKNIPLGTQIFNIERNPGDGGKMIRTAGSSAILFKKYTGKISVVMKNKKEILLDEKCRASLGIIAGAGRIQKPIIKAGKMFYKKKSKSKLWPRTSAVKVNAIDHPFGSGRGKRIKSKIAKRNAPPGRRVGHILPRKTGRKR